MIVNIKKDLMIFVKKTGIYFHYRMPTDTFLVLMRARSAP